MFKNTKNRLGIVGELFSFLWKRKLWWLMPIIVVLLALVVLLVFVPAAVPFLYTLL